MAPGDSFARSGPLTPEAYQISIVVRHHPDLVAKGCLQNDALIPNLTLGGRVVANRRKPVKGPESLILIAHEEASGTLTRWLPQ